MVRPSVSFASIVWAHDTSLQKTNRWLSALDQLALNKSITHSARSCPTRGLAIVLDLLPLPFFLRRAALHAVLRHPDLARLDWIGRSRTKNHSTSHRFQWSATLGELGLPLSTVCSKALSPSSSFRVVRDSFFRRQIIPSAQSTESLHRWLTHPQSHWHQLLPLRGY